MGKREEPRPKRKTSVAEVLLRLQAAQNPEIEEYLRRIRRRYGRYATSASEVRAMMDKALGGRTLSDELYKLRDR